jgi:hypothetical protein
MTTLETSQQTPSVAQNIAPHAAFDIKDLAARASVELGQLVTPESLDSSRIKEIAKCLARMPKIENTFDPVSSSAGVIKKETWTKARGAASTSRVIQLAVLRHLCLARLDMATPPAEQRADLMANLPKRGQALRTSFLINMEEEAMAQRREFSDYAKDLADGRTTAGRGESWIAYHFFGMRHESAHAPGSDGYILSEDKSLELFSVKSCARSGISFQLSSLTAHGTRVMCDTLAVIGSLNLTHHQAIVDTRDFPEVTLTLFPSMAAEDWARAGLLSKNGLTPEQFKELLEASCPIVIQPSRPVDKAELAATNKVQAAKFMADREAAKKAEADKKAEQEKRALKAIERACSGLAPRSKRGA